jgi:hypothetical protein
MVDLVAACSCAQLQQAGTGMGPLVLDPTSAEEGAATGTMTVGLLPGAGEVRPGDDWMPEGGVNCSRWGTHLPGILPDIAHAWQRQANSMLAPPPLPNPNPLGQPVVPSSHEKKEIEVR